MLDPCSPCVCYAATCEQCMFGYQSQETNHKTMKELLLAYIAGKRPCGWKCAELYMMYHRNWKEELGEDVSEKSTKPDSNEITLKSCPFCGGEAILCKDVRPDGQISYKVAYVKCSSCGINTGAYIIDGYYDVKTTVYDAINAWNRRVVDKHAD